MAFSFFLNLPDNSHPQVKKGEKVEKGQKLATYQRFKKTSINLIKKLSLPPKKIKKLLKCKLGEKVTKGDPLACQKSLLGKNTIKSPVTGQVFSYDEKEGQLIIKTKGEKRQLLAPVNGKIVKVEEKQIQLTIPESQALAAEISGKQVMGTLIPLPDNIFALDKKFKGKIAFAKKISPALFKKAKVVGLKGLIINENNDLAAPPAIAVVNNLSDLKGKQGYSVIIDPEQEKIALFKQ